MRRGFTSHANAPPCVVWGVAHAYPTNMGVPCFSMPPWVKPLSVCEVKGCVVWIGADCEVAGLGFPVIKNLNNVGLCFPLLPAAPSAPCPVAVAVCRWPAWGTHKQAAQAHTWR